MQYRESPPSLRFANLVKCFWSLEYQNSEIGEPEPVVPDGCVEIIFNLSDRFRRYHENGEVENQAASIVAGQMNRSILIGPSGNVRLFGIRFKPTGAFPFFRFGMNELTNRIEPLDAIWGPEVALAEEQLALAESFEVQTLIAENILAKRFSDRTALDPFLDNIIRVISAAKGIKPVHGIAKDVGVSERGLERRFRQSVGLSPKIFSRIIRFQRVLKTLETAAEPDILDTALSFGYYDQSHLINDFRQFAGASPSAFMEKSAGMTELFINAD